MSNQGFFQSSETTNCLLFSCFRESDMLIGPAIDLLNSPDAVFNSAQVSQCIKRATLCSDHEVRQ